MGSLERLNAIMEAEQYASDEVRTFCHEKVYPAHEIGIIRKNFKSFKEEQEKVLNSNENESTREMKRAAEVR